MKIYIIAILIFTGLTACAQNPRKLYQDTTFQLMIKGKSTISMPLNYDAKKKYPLLVFLPFTGGTAEDYVFKLAGNADGLIRDLFPADESGKSFFVLCPAEEGSDADHSWKGFEACIYRYEKKIIEDIGLLSTKYGIDTNRIILCGFSLGGDLAWAITQRYPEKFKGAIISGSRCSYFEKGMMTRQAKKGFKYYFAMGSQEAPDRVNGLNSAINSLKQTGIRYHYTQLDGGHVGFSMDQLREGVNFILYSD